MLCNSKDICYLQFAAYKSAICESDNDQKLKGLKNALFMTLPGFQFDKILDYRLSWIELTILNNICRTYATINPTHGIYCFYKLLEYTSHVPLDVLEKKRSFPVTLGMLIRISLYRKSSFGNRCVSPAFFRCYKFNVFYREHFFTLLSGIRITWSHKFRKGICTLCLLQCPPYGGHLQCIRSEK